MNIFVPNKGLSAHGVQNIVEWKAWWFLLVINVVIKVECPKLGS